MFRLPFLIVIEDRVGPIKSSLELFFRICHHPVDLAQSVALSMVHHLLRLVVSKASRDNLARHCESGSNHVPEVDPGVAVFGTKYTMHHIVELPELRGASHDRKRVLAVSAPRFDLGGASNNRINDDVLLLVAKRFTVINRRHDIIFINRVAREVHLPECFNCGSDSGEGN